MRADALGRHDDLTVHDLIARARWRGDALLHPGAQVAKRLVQHTQVADGVGRALLALGVVTVQGVVGEPEPEVVVGARSRGARSTFDRYQSACHGSASRSRRDSTTIIFPSKRPVCTVPAAAAANSGPEQQGALGIDGRAVGVAELVPDGEVAARHLVAVVGLCREVPAVVDLDRVARLELRRGRRDPRGRTTRCRPPP